MNSRKKTVLGQFFTREKSWLKPQVLDFIRSSGCDAAFDPFAGEGHLLQEATKIGFTRIYGYDIDESLGWPMNDSLISIPHIDEKTMIITNPPYLSNYSASRKKVMAAVKKYFDSTAYDDLYLLALDNMLKSQKYVIAIIPETFIGSNFRNKHCLRSITILEENPFEDSDTPVIVACFDGERKDYSEISVYKNEERVNDLDAIEKMRLTPQNDVKIVFNDNNGWLAVRCVDTTNPKEMLRFDIKENIKYKWDEGIKVSSRLLTLIDVDVPSEKRDVFITECNTILNKLRADTADVILSPFKGNMKNGQRRRRLDFRTCRAIIEIAHKRTVLAEERVVMNDGQLRLF